MRPHERLEVEFGKWAGVENVVACSSGTAALHLALEALELPAGSYVLVPDYTMVACARAVVLAGLQPALVDCGEDGLVDPAQLEAACRDLFERSGDWLAAIMPVHVYGRRCDMDAVADLARRYDLYVVEDLAEAHGVPVHPATDAACWSFYRNKIIAGEEGGAVAFRQPECADLARSLRTLGFTEAHDYNHIPRGHNYRLADCLAEKVLTSLEEYAGVFNAVGHIGGNYKTRRKYEGWYDAFCPPKWYGEIRDAKDAPWVYDLRIRGMTREKQREVVEELRREGIAARYGFKPMSRLEEFREMYLGRVPVYYDGWSRAEVLSREVIYLPLTPGEVTRESAAKAFEVISRVLR